MSLASVMGPPLRQCHGTTCRGLQRRRRDVRRAGGAGSTRVGVGDGGLLSLAVGLAVEDEFVGG
jgi:hypothetical protein